MFDENYVKLYAHLVSRDDDGNKVSVEQPFHDCTDEDWAQFYPPDTDTITYIKHRAVDYGVEE